MKIASSNTSKSLGSLVYLTAIDVPSNCTTSSSLRLLSTYNLELSHGGTTEKGDLNISINFWNPLWHLIGHIHYVTIPDTGPGGQQLLLFEFNGRRGWNMGHYKEHVPITEPRGIEFRNNAVQRYATYTFQSYVRI